MSALMVFSMAASLLPFSHFEPPKKVALLVGVAKYRHSTMNKPQPLQFPEIDARSVGDQLKECGYEVVFLLGAEATQTAIRAKLKEVPKQGEDGGVLLIGLFGHGVEYGDTKEACFCPFDASIRDAKDGEGKQLFDKDGASMVEPEPDSLVKLSEVLSALRTSGASNKVLLADCCRTQPNRARGRAFGASFSETKLPVNTAVLFACSANEQAFEHPDWGHGAFSKCFLEQVAELRGRGPVTVGTLADRIRPEVLKLVRTRIPRDTQTTRSLVADVVDLQLPAIRPTLPKPEAPTFPYSESEARSYQRRFAAWAKKPLEITGVNGTELVLIPPGSFMMGNEDSVEDLLKLFPYGKKEWFDGAQPQRLKRITQPFYLGKYEVTRGEFRRFVEATGYQTEAEKDGKGGYGWTGNDLEQKPEYTWRNTGFEQDDRHPVVNVSWNDAQAYVDWLNGKGEGRYRLPWESEWEYACRAGSGTRFLKGNDQETLKVHANVGDAALKRAAGESAKNWKLIEGDDGHALTAAVGSYGVRGANGFGLSDMIGNALEWCEDKYDKDFYVASEESDPRNPTDDKAAHRVFRGGSWDGLPAGCRAAYRDRVEPAHRFVDLGFRVASVP